MSSSTIFFSYGRDNSAFVLDLAKELRKAGANIWLDQLDIEPGTRWDRSIERALKASDTLLVVLSKDSVESNNVMDEVSYALEENKTVVPVLMETCEIPFRLRRLQYADFTENHKTGITTLIKALRLDDIVASKLSDNATNENDASINNDIEKINKLRREQDTKLKEDRLKETKLREEAEKKARQQQEREQKKSIPKPIKPIPQKSSGMSSWIVGGIVLIGFAALFFIVMAIGFTDDSGDNTIIKTTDDTIYNPVTPPNNNNNSGATNTENKVNTPAHASDWKRAQQANTMEMYLTYIDTYGQTNEHFYDAVSSMDALLKHSGYMQYATADGSTRYFNRLNIIEGIDSYPQPNDYITTILSGYVWGSVPGIDYNAQQTGAIIPPGKYLFVTDVVYSNGIPWVQVRYGD